MKRIILFSVLSLLLSATIGCEKDEKKTIDKELLGTWKCIGFGNTVTDKIKPIEPQSCEKCYTITYKENGTLLGTSAFVNMKMNYSIIADRIVFDKKYMLTDIGEVGDGDEFRHYITRDKNKFLIKENKLLIFYTKTEYLLFKFIK